MPFFEFTTYILLTQVPNRLKVSGSRASWMKPTANSDAVKRLEIYGDLEQYLIDQALVLPIGWRHESVILVVPDLGQRLRLAQVRRFQMVKDVWFDETAPERPLPSP